MGIYPSGDDFAAGTPNFGVSPSAYLRVKPWDTNPETVTTQSHQAAWGELTDAYFDDVLTNPAGQRIAVPTRHSSLAGGSGADWLAWVAYRALELLDGEAAISPNLLMRQGAFDDDSFRGAGIFGRWSAGTAQAPGGGNATDRYFDAVDCYLVLHGRDGGASTNRIFLVRVNAGVPALLDSRFVGSLAGASNANEASLRPVRMRMRITGTSPVRIQVWRQRVIGSGEDVVFDLNDASVNRIAVAGRWGFGGQVAKVQAAAQEAVLAFGFFLIKSVATGAVLLLDDWSRTLQAAARQVTDQVPLTGRSLAQSFTGDLLGRQDTSAGGPTVDFFALLDHAPVAGEVEVGRDVSATFPSSQAIYGWHFSQRPATSNAQHRAITATFSSSITTEVVRAGVMVRGTVFENLVGDVDLRARVSAGGTGLDYLKRGYMAQVLHTPGGGTPWIVEVFFFDEVTGSSAYVAERLASFVPGALATGTPFTLQVEVQNFDGDPFGIGDQPAIKVTLNGTVVALVADAVQGVSVIGDWLVDGRSEAIDAGAMEGFFFDPSAYLASGLCIFDDWVEKPLSNPPESQPNAEPSVVMLPETAGKFGALETPASWPYVVDKSYERIYHPFETGHHQTFLRFSRPRRIFEIEARNVTSNDRATLLARWNANKGVEVPFDWTDPKTSEVLVGKFVDDELGYILESLVGDGTESFSFRIMELFEHVVFGA